MLLLEQLLNGLQFSVFLFLLSSGLTLVFGIMGVINLAHGSFYMIGAYASTFVYQYTGSFALALVMGVGFTAMVGIPVEKYLISHLYKRDHLEQVLVCVGLIYIADETVGLLFGRDPRFLPVPWGLDAPVEFFGGFQYSAYRLLIIAVGLAVALGLFFLIHKTRIGMQIRAGESDRVTIEALGINIDRLFVTVFTLGCCLAGLAGVFAGPLLSIEIGMGSGILIYAFVCVVIGGLGSVAGSFVGSLLVGIGDTLARVFLPDVFGYFMPADYAAMLAGGVSSMFVFFIMILVLMFRPYGIFGEKR